MSKTAVNPKYLKVNDADKDYHYNKKLLHHEYGKPIHY